MRARDAQVGMWGSIAFEEDKQAKRAIVRIEQHVAPGEVGVSRWELEGAAGLQRTVTWMAVKIDSIEPVPSHPLMLRCLAAEYEIRATKLRIAAKEAEESAERVRRTLSEVTAFESKGTLS